MSEHHLQRPGTKLRSCVCWDLQAVHDVDELLQVLALLCKGHLRAAADVGHEASGYSLFIDIELI